MNYSIIIPFYNEEKNVSKLNKEIIEVLKIYFKETIRKFEIIYVDDCSKDNTFEELKLTITNQFKTKIIKHKKNLSQSSALFTGITLSSYNNLIFITSFFLGLITSYLLIKHEKKIFVFLLIMKVFP